MRHEVDLDAGVGDAPDAGASTGAAFWVEDGAGEEVRGGVSGGDAEGWRWATAAVAELAEGEPWVWALVIRPRSRQWRSESLEAGLAAAAVSLVSNGGSQR